MNIYIGEPVVVSDMQGPAPDGFHVPLSSEWEGIGGLKEIMSGLGLTTGDSWRINLHLPFAGKRNPSNSAISNQGSRGYYWSSSPYDGNQYNSRDLLMEPSGVYQNSSYPRANGFSIRCFKNSFVAPDSNWTVVQGTLGSAGIFWNQTEGLISITSDGITGHTIQDKNLGATTVYNDGDTLSEANCGKYYQWGNNYGFSRTGSVTTSSTIVNASTYGPGNYYESNTFIVNSSYEGYWDSSLNTNLRGGVSQGTSTKSVEVKNIYIGEYGWNPGSNTIAYYPLTSSSTVNDMSGNNKTLTNYNNVQFGTYNGVDCCYCNGSNRLWNTSVSTTYIGQTSTMSVWITKTSTNDMWVGNANNYPSYSKHIGLNLLLSSGSVRYGGGGNNNTWNDITYNTSIVADTWYNIIQTIGQDGTRKCYLNGQLVASGTLTVGLDNAWFTVGAAQYNDGEIYYMGGNASEVIIENKARTAEEILNYYNSTKSNYGL